ncbi:mucin-13 isoform X2 [Crotalus tigris]|uniref:mucin-13 isoform X2 n=1 Tax=Crotalus tigris TaxID=88082 RepID=UPI00192F43EF|nr:mucin-13 isoform X2 [Crotalus tigris]
MKSFTFFGVLWLALGHVRPSSQSMIDYLPYNTEPRTEPCPNQMSIYGAKCLQLFSKNIYQCPYGFYYNSSCRLGKVFPGEVILNIPYNESMGDTTSQNYEKLYDNLTNFFDQTFENTFREITILNVKLRVNKVEDKNKPTVTDTATVMLITGFDEEANMTAQDLETRVKNSTFLNDSIISSFTSKTGCDIGICDNDTTDCRDVEGGIPKCECKKDLAKMNLEDKACRLCDSSCSAANNRFCLMEADLVPQCRCLQNFEEKDGECEACSIGFSGEDCQDNYMAIIIGVSTTGGVLLVALIGVTTYFLVRKQDSKAGHQQLISNEYSTLGNPSGGIDSGEDSGRIFPRIKTTNAADNPTDFYEGGAANRGYVPEREYRNDNVSGCFSG